MSVSERDATGDSETRLLHVVVLIWVVDKLSIHLWGSKLLVIEVTPQLTASSVGQVSFHLDVHLKLILGIRIAESGSVFKIRIQIIPISVLVC